MPTSFETKKAPRPIAKPSDNPSTKEQTGVTPIRSKNPGGRPTLISEDKVKKLEEAFRIDSTVEQACLFAEISERIFYNRCKADPTFLQRMRAAQAYYHVLLKDSVAKQAITRKDGSLALKVLERIESKKYGKDPEVQNVTQFFQQTNIYTSDRSKLDELSTQELLDIVNAPPEVIDVEATPLQL